MAEMRNAVASVQIGFISRAKLRSSIADSLQHGVR